MAAWLTISVTWIVRAGSYFTRAMRAAQCRRHARSENRAVRGITLLREWLSPQQRQQLECHGHFEVIGSDSGKSYRILHGLCQNVFELGTDGQPRMGWCFLPEGNLVPGDVMLAQKIALETDEWGALAIAKRFLVSPRLPDTVAPT